MSCRSSWSLVSRIAAVSLMLVALNVPLVLAQHGSTGTVVVTVLDSSGAVVAGAQLELRDLSTNDLRRAETQDAGGYTFVNLTNGTYKLTVSMAGYKSQIFAAVVVQASQTTSLKSTLTVGAISEVVEVTETATPLLETSSNAVGTAIDLKQIEDLPLGGRDISQLSQLVPGYAGGTWDGLPQTAQGNSIDGVVGSTSRMKFAGNGTPDVSPRLENIQEMTVQTEQLDMNQGFGQANMQVNFITRRGGNAFHGRLFEDFRNTALNANSWSNNASGLPKNIIKRNEFGGSVGGPIFKDKLFFFGSFSMSKQPGTINAQNPVLVPAAQGGDYTYTGTDDAVHTVNVLDIAGGAGIGLPSTVNAAIAGQMQAINGALGSGALTANAGDANVSTLNWLLTSPENYYYPTFRIDYNISQKYRLNFSFNETKHYQNSALPAPFPGSSFEDRGAGNKFKYYTASLGFDWTVSPTIINEFRAGYLYHAESYAYNAKGLYLTEPQVNWALANSGASFQTPTGTLYPIVNASDTLTLQRSAHTIKFGFSFYREQDHYYNNPVGWPTVQLGLIGGDPAYSVFDNGPSSSVPNATTSQLNEARNLYATLVGRITGISGSYTYDQKTKAYSTAPQGYFLDELQKAWGLFFQDSYRIKPNLTLNYGLRWDFTGDDHDLTSAYHQALPAAVFGPSGVWNVFNPGSLTGDQDPALIATSHQYAPWNVSPQPAFGFAWDPRSNGKTVIRGGISLRKYTEPYQYFWDNASDYGSFFYQFFQTNASNSGGIGTFPTGSLALGTTQPCYAETTCPAYLLQPAAYQAVAPESQFTFTNNFYANDAHGLDPHIRQPYTTSWNLGIQRELTRNNVIEIRYVGSRSVHQWLAVDANEVNVFENGFLSEFQHAAGNLSICEADAGCSANPSFANNGLAGQVGLPLMSAAFAGEDPGGDGNLYDFTNSQFTTYLRTGSAGAFAQQLTTTSGTTNYFCNLVGSSFAPCLNNANYSGAGAGYPINLFQANPFNSGLVTNFLTDKGYATHNSLQVDFRQKTWHGMQFDVNYTWGHTLGTNPSNNWLGNGNQFTLRNLRMSYNPTLDVRHVVHANGTYDLPFGKGKQFLSSNNVLDKVVGGWTVGTIVTFQTGLPFQMFGGYNTVNDYADGGVALNGVTASQLQSSVGVYRVPGSAFVDVINPKYLASTQGGANAGMIAPNTTAGTFGHVIFLHGPHAFYDDMSLSKTVPIRENLRFSLQAEFLNIFNHPTFTNGPDFGVQDQGFGTVGGPNGFGREIELRANFEF